MADVTTQSASSPADVFDGQEVSFTEFSKFRESGELPDRFKPAEPVESATTSEVDKTESASESEPEEESQEQPQKGSAAEKRIKQLLAKTKELERKLADAAKPTQTDSSTAQATQSQPPQSYADYRKTFKPSLFIENFAKANPDASYEDANAAMADHMLDVREHFRTIEQRVTAERQALEAKVSEAKQKYEDFDEIKTSFLAKVISDKGAPLIPVQVLGIINDSDYLADVLYTIGNDEAELAKFIEMAKASPGKAIRYVARVENLIAEELAKPRDESGKFAAREKAAPEPKRTGAPKPPSPVTGGSSRAFDVSDDSLSPEEWMRKRNKQLGIG